MKAHELRDMTDEELGHRMHEACDALFSLRVQAVTGELDDSRAIRRTRRTIARIKTLVSERSRASSQAGVGSE